MQKSDLFAYLAAFVTIVLAIALTDLAQSTHRLIRSRARVRWDALPLLTALYVYFTVLAEFFAIWSNLQVDRFSYFQLVGQMLVPTLIAMSAFAVLPDDVSETGVDLREFYFAQRRYWTVLFLLLMIADITRNIVAATQGGYIDDWRFWGFIAPMTAIYLTVFALMWWARRWAWHLTALITLNLAAWYGYYVWSIRVG